MAAPNEAAAEKGTQVIKANLVCASVKLRIENVSSATHGSSPLPHPLTAVIVNEDDFVQFETLRSLTRMVESEEFSVPPNDACAAPITWQLELEFGDKIRAGEEMNPLYQLLVANQLRLKHKGQLVVDGGLWGWADLTHISSATIHQGGVHSAADRRS
jgi:hypothetical protein